MYLLTFCAFIGMSKGNPMKTLSSMMVGFALAAVGQDGVTGTLRMTFGTEVLIKGFDFLIAVIGLFGIGEILQTLEEGLEFKGIQAKINRRVVLDTWKELAEILALPSLRSAAVELLHGHQARGRHACVVHELRHGAAHEPERRQIRQHRGPSNT